MYVYLCIFISILYHSWRAPLDLLKLIKSIYVTSLWVYQALWRHTKKHCVKLSILETTWAGDMTIFGSHVDPHMPNIGYLEANEGICVYMDVYEGI